jgi:flagellar assembly factor FliW
MKRGGIKLATTRFGEVELTEEQLLTFPEGLPGLPGKRWALLPSPTNARISWLQSAERADVALLLIDPCLLIPDYRASPKPEEIRGIFGETDEKPVCRVVIRSGEQPGELIANLFAPVLMHPALGLGMQVPLVGSSYGVREVWPRPGVASTDPL